MVDPLFGAPVTGLTCNQPMLRSWRLWVRGCLVVLVGKHVAMFLRICGLVGEIQPLS